MKESELCKLVAVHLTQFVGNVCPFWGSEDTNLSDIVKHMKPISAVHHMTVVKHNLPYIVG